MAATPQLTRRNSITSGFRKHSKCGALGWQPDKHAFNERLDLMIDGKSRSDLELYRATLMEKGLSVDAIAQDQFFGHDYFQLVDPDGNGITVYTSHTEELSV